MRRLRCQGCGRPMVTCWCAFVKPASTRHRIIVLQHPDEAREIFGTVRVLCRVLPQVEVITGVSFAEDLAADLLRDPERPPALLFPGPDAQILRAGRDRRARTLLVIDGTWTQARKMFAMNRWLHGLPAWRLAPARPSLYTLRQAPEPDCLCTVESVAEALGLLDDDATARDALIAPLQAMVGLQQAAADAGSSAALANRAELARAGYLPPAP